MILQLTGGRILHTAYSNNNLGDPEGFSLISQAGATYKGTYIDESTTESTDPKDYYWEELFNPDIDDTDDAGNYGTLTNEAELAALQSQITALQTRSQEMAEAITNNQNNASSAANAAGQAQAIAQATGQHFWADSSGVHVANEANNAEADRNMILNTLGALFRKGANNLLAILAGDTTDTKGLTVYDGAGNSAGNIIAAFLGNTVFFQNNGIQTFELLSTSESPAILEIFNADTSKMSEPSRTDATYNYYDFTVNLALPLNEVISVKIGYSYQILTAGTPKGTGGVDMTPDTPGEWYDIEHNGMTLGHVSFTSNSANNSILITLRISQALAPEIILNMKNPQVWYTTSETDVSKLYMGAYPDKDEGVLFAIGNGSASKPSNAFTVDWGGNINCNNLFYQPGEYYAETYAHARAIEGYISSSATTMYFEIPMPKRLDNVYYCEISEITGGIRGVNGYVDGKSNGSDLSGYDIVATIDNPNYIYLSLSKGAALGNATNNTPVTLALNSLALTFSDY